MSAPISHDELSDSEDTAALWLGTHWFDAPRPLVPHIRRKFPDLTALGAIRVLRVASAMQGGSDGTA